ncbi:glycosyltransferase family 2 protein [Nocardia takedensis]|uniref:glycosyltransferase family 2 protein n=1 Tax=Nocardia takedensis TaxID=259390 RepID=UPI00031C79A7|nr:galactosyltransferase-related protein [Nocardia takedensis]
MRTAVITIAAHRRTHLRNQLAGLRAATERADHHIVVSMGDPDIVTTLRGTGADCVELPPRSPLPLAAARNTGARAALAVGAELLVFLDVDCVPSPQLLTRYRHAARHTADRLLCGPVTYLPPPPALGYDLDHLADLRDPHPARPDPPPDSLLDGDDPALFWSLSFAIPDATWRRIGGFDTRYRGYGGEDTDFAYRAAELGIRPCWVGGADSYHQHHPVEDPPIGHLADILANARTFHDRWGWWPMGGWLEGFRSAGLITYHPDHDTWTPTEAGTATMRTQAPSRTRPVFAGM